jgi:hypothetical protein
VNYFLFNFDVLFALFALHLLECRCHCVCVLIYFFSIGHMYLICCAERMISRDKYIIITVDLRCMRRKV